MRFVRLSATFGVLQRRTLAFAPGLNIIEAPNESGKSTLSSFLKAMLYGLPARERGAAADKNRFLPWSGAPMQGTLDLICDPFGAVTITRDTARAASPMGRFSAVRTGTADEVAALTAADCGDILLGVPREVYERSAFIRQGSLAVDSTAELERRVAALITTGEEGVSYSEASAALRKQLNARRLNARRGLIPTLEREFLADSSRLDELHTLQRERDAATRSIDELREQETALKKALDTHRIADIQEQYAAREYAKRDADTAERRERQFRAMLTEMRVPSREILAENQLRLDALDGLSLQLADADAVREDADAALYAYRKKPKPLVLRPISLLWCALCFVCAGLSIQPWLRPQTCPPGMRWIIAAAPLFAVLFALDIRRGSRRQKAHRQQLDTLTEALRGADAACGALKTQRERILAQIYKDIPAGDETSARAYIVENLERRDTLSRMERDAADKRQAYESYPPMNLRNIPAYPVTRPAQSPEALRSGLEQLEAQRGAAQSRADIAAGRIAAIGSAEELEAELNRKREQLEAAQEEYDAIAMAMDALDQANASLQGRFSPALGKRAAAYFAALTGGKYDAVVLDREFHALATERGESVPRDAMLLSRGAGDQLYLAVRLAICDTVLPPENNVPLVLDDALISFDDARCAAALELLVNIARTRQILLLTCQHREAACLAGRENVNIISL